MTDYTPVDCAVYSAYELAIVRHTRLRIAWREPKGQAHVAILKPRDLKTANHEEFLVAEDLSGNTLTLRLDHIHKAEPA